LLWDVVVCFVFLVWGVWPYYKVSNNVYVQKAEKKIVFTNANLYFWQKSAKDAFHCQKY